MLQLNAVNAVMPPKPENVLLPFCVEAAKDSMPATSRLQVLGA